MNDSLEPVTKRLSRWLSQAAREARPEAVHRLRTHIRRGEVLLGARLANDPKLRRRLRRLRHRAGGVRDLDVQIEMLRHLHLASDGGRRALLESMETERRKRARKLRQKLDPPRRRSLLRRLRRAGAAPDSGALPAGRPGLAALLGRFPTLDEGNLHDFRKACKQLRYRTEAIADDDPAGIEAATLAEALHRVQDAIGAWHDWSELSLRAQRLADLSAPLAAALQNATTAHFSEAVRVSNRLRSASDALPAPAAPPRRHGVARVGAPPPAAGRASA